LKVLIAADFIDLTKGTEKLEAHMNMEILANTQYVIDRPLL
jgi:hypothetical protein